MRSALAPVGRDRDDVSGRLARRSGRRARHGARARAHDVPRHEKPLDERARHDRDGARRQLQRLDHRHADAVPVHRAGRRPRRGAADRVGPHARRARRAVAVGERARRDRAGGAARRVLARQRLLSRRAAARVQGHAVRPRGRRHQGRLRPPDRPADQGLPRPLVRAQQRRAGGRRRRRPGARAGPDPGPLRGHPQARGAGPRGGAPRAAGAHRAAPADPARLPAGGGRVPLPGREQPGLPALVRAAGHPRLGARPGARAGDTGEALDAQWISLPYVPEAQIGLASAALGPSGDPERGRAAAGEHSQGLRGARRAARAVRVDPPPAHRRAGGEPQLDRLAGLGLGDHDRARPRALDRARAGADRAG